MSKLDISVIFLDGIYNAFFKVLYFYSYFTEICSYVTKSPLAPLMAWRRLLNNDPVHWGVTRSLCVMKIFLNCTSVISSSSWYWRIWYPGTLYIYWDWWTPNESHGPKQSIFHSGSLYASMMRKFWSWFTHMRLVPHKVYRVYYPFSMPKQCWFHVV